MRQSAPQKRGRGRSGGGNRRNYGGSQGNRSFDSSGPDVKIRGTASHIYDKYQTLARDALVSGDRIASENYLQHAEHYYRLLTAQNQQSQQNQQNQPNQQQQSNAPQQQNAQPAAQPNPQADGQSKPAAAAGAPGHGDGRRNGQAAPQVEPTPSEPATQPVEPAQPAADMRTVEPQPAAGPTTGFGDGPVPAAVLTPAAPAAGAPPAADAAAEPAPPRRRRKPAARTEPADPPEPAEDPSSANA